jgi:hypothetical protein
MSATPLQAGAGMILRMLGFGQSISALKDAQRWRHPWSTQPAWSRAQQRWIATVKPGFVNGQCPVVRTTIREQAQEGRDFGTNPLTGRPFFSDSVFAPLPTTNGELRQVDAPLYLSPAISLGWRALGFDSANDEAVPIYFLDRGASERPRQANSDGDAVPLPIDATTEVPRGLRLLRACDLWIHQPRQALTSTIELHPGLATGVSNVSQTLGLASPAAGDVLRVMSGTLRTIDGIDALARIYEEPAYDELLIATVFALSPPGVELFAQPDEAWTLYVRHNLFWNLNYATPWFRQYGGSPTVPFIPPLAGGAAQLVINFLTASINDILQDALNLVTSHSMAGTFYTPTGGGSSALLPPVATGTTATGLDKRAKRDADAATKARARQDRRLDPTYPFRAEPFDPRLLTQTV